MTDELFRKEAINNHRERLWGDVILIQPLAFKILVAVIFSIVTSALLYLCFNDYVKRERVVGYLVPDKGVVKIYAPSFGTVEASKIAEGTPVKSGEFLLNISTKRSTSELMDINVLITEQLEKEKDSLERKIVREKEYSNSELDRLKAQVRNLNKEKIQLVDQIKNLNQRLNIAQDKLNTNRELVEQGFLPKTVIGDYEDRYYEIKASLSNAHRLLESINSQISNAIKQKNQQPIQADSKLSDLERMQTGLDNRLLERLGQQSYAIRSPVNGNVSFLQAKNGQNVSLNAPLMTILPEGTTLFAELFVPTRAVGFIEKGQDVLIRYAAFPYQRFGLHKGVIQDISQVILAPNEVPVPVPLQEPVYKVVVAINAQHIVAKGKEISLQAGMMIEADILVDERSLIEWLLEPIYSLRGSI